MLRAAPMSKVHIMILDRHMQRVTRVLGEMGAVHLQSSTDDQSVPLEQENVQERAARLRDLRERLRHMLECLGVDVPLRPDVEDVSGSLEDVEVLLAELEKATGERVRKLEAMERAREDTEEIIRELAPYRAVRTPISRLQDSAFLAIRVGRVGRVQWEGLRRSLPEGVFVVPLGEGRPASADEPVALLAVAGRRRRFAMETVLDEYGFTAQSLPVYEEQTPAEVYTDAVGKCDRLREDARQQREELSAVGASHRASLLHAAALLVLEERMLEAQAKFGSTWATVVITGWVPRARAEELRDAVMHTTDGQAVVEVTEPTAEDLEGGRVPSSGVRNKLLAPFERLVSGYGTAGYTEIEPTLLFAASYLLLFGIVFGDLGHGLLLLIAGVVLRRKAGKAALRDIGYVVAACGLSSMLFGTFIQGSFFGKSLGHDFGFPFTLNFEPIRLGGEATEGNSHVVRYLILALTVGMALISLGALLNIVNRLRRRDYMQGLLGRFGLTGILFYWGALGLALTAVVHPQALSLPLVCAVLGLPLLVLVLHEPIYGLLTGRRPLWHEGPMMGFFSGLIEAMETVMSYLANTFSFLRVAAFALSHTALCYTVFVLGELVAGMPLAPVWQVLIFIVGTLVIICLEGLIVSIQILRLEYYEFFTKFFGGEGVRYRPFRLDGNAEEEV